MVPLDGSELSFLFLFGFTVNLWIHDVFVAPGVMLVLQYAFLWPLFLDQDPTHSAVRRYHLGQAFSVWAGALSSMFINHMLESEKPLTWDWRHKRRMAVSLSLMLSIAFSPWAALLSRIWMAMPWAAVPAIVLAIALYVLVGFVGLRALRAAPFSRRRDERRFVYAGATVHILVLFAFGAIDYAFGDRGDDDTTGYVMRCLVLLTVLCTTGAARLVHHWTCGDHLLMSEWPAETAPVLRTASRDLIDVLGDTDDDDDQKTDADYLDL